MTREKQTTHFDSTQSDFRDWQVIQMVFHETQLHLEQKISGLCDSQAVRKVVYIC